MLQSELEAYEDIYSENRSIMHSTADLICQQADGMSINELIDKVNTMMDRHYFFVQLHSPHLYITIKVSNILIHNYISKHKIKYYQLQYDCT